MSVGRKGVKLVPLFLIATTPLLAGEVTDAFRVLARQASAVHVIAASSDGRPALETTYTGPDIARTFVDAFDFSDPKPTILPDGQKIHPGPCKCLPTHSVTFILPNSEELVLLLNLEAPILVDVEEKEIERLRIPWHTSLRLTPESGEAVSSLLKRAEEEANQPVSQRRGADAPQRG